jgi:hypothetical protein
MDSDAELLSILERIADECAIRALNSLMSRWCSAREFIETAPTLEMLCLDDTPG